MTRLVTRILAAKRADAAADVTAWEREIDERVHRLYQPAPRLWQADGLTPEENKMVEEGVQK